MTQVWHRAYGPRPNDLIACRSSKLCATCAIYVDHYECMVRVTTLDGPNCFLLNLSPIASSIHLPTNYSQTLLIVNVNNIILMSCSTDFGGFILCIGPIASCYNVFLSSSSTRLGYYFSDRRVEDPSRITQMQSHTNQFGRRSGTLVPCKY